MLEPPAGRPVMRPTGVLAAGAGRLSRGRVQHAPDRIRTAVCPSWSTAPLSWDGLPVPLTPPVSVLTAAAVDVRIFPLQREATPKALTTRI